MKTYFSASWKFSPFSNVFLTFVKVWKKLIGFLCVKEKFRLSRKPKHPQFFRRSVCCVRKKCLKGNRKSTFTGVGPFQVGASYTQWHRIHVPYKRRTNLQHEVCVTFATWRKRKNCTTESAVWLLEYSWTENKTSWEQGKRDAADTFKSFGKP